MRRFKFHKLFVSGSALVLIVVIVFFVNYFSSPQGGSKVQAAQSQEHSLSGYGWSSTIGWISFSGTATNGGTYSVSVDDSGNLSGYAWASTIGWLKFGGLSGFPSGSGTTGANANLTGSGFTGWARFCAGMNDQTAPPDQTVPNDNCTGTTRGDGWGGWLSLKGTIYGVSLTGNPGPSDGSHYLSGYAWGSTVVGWVDMSRVYLTDDGVIVPPVPSNTSAHAVAGGGCFVEVTWSVTPDPAPVGTTFSVHYKDGTTVASGLSANIRSYLDTNTVAGETYSYFVRATYNGSSVDSPLSNEVTVSSDCNSQIALPPQIGSFKAIPPAVPLGQSCSLTWAGIQNIDLSTDGHACIITGPNMNYPLGSPSDGSTPTPPIEATSRYTLTCTNPSGTATAAATCSLKPKFDEF